MSKFEIISDSAADLSESYAREAHVEIVPYYVSMDGITYMKEGKEIGIAEFHQMMADHADCFPKTSMPAIQDYVDAFTPYAQKEIPVLCVCLSGKFSGSLQSAINARMAVQEEYPNADIYVMDSQLVTALQGLLVKEAVRLRDLGKTLEEAVPLLEEIRSSGEIIFTTKDLKYLEHGGRLGKAATAAANVLNLKPILHFCDGELQSTEVCRGRKKSVEKIVDRFFKLVESKNIDLSEYWFGTGIGMEVPDYEDFKASIAKRFDETGVHPYEWIHVNIGATIGVHTGPYPMGLGILKKCKV